MVLPYLAPEDLATMALADIRGGSHSGLATDYAADPVSWWTRRGIRRIVFMEPDPDSDSPRAPAAIDPLDPDREREIGDIQARMRLGLHAPGGDAEAGLKRPRSLRREYLAGIGTAFHREWASGAARLWRSGDWLLVPYVHPVADAVRLAFREALMRHLGPVPTPAAAEFREKLVEHLREREAAKQLVALYSDYFGRGHNAISMSLYSGPATAMPEPQHQDWSLDRAIFGMCWPRQPVGSQRAALR